MKKKKFIIIMVFLVSALFCNLFCLEMKSENKLVALLGKVEAMAEGEDDTEKPSKPITLVSNPDGTLDTCCEDTQEDRSCGLTLCSELYEDKKKN